MKSLVHGTASKPIHHPDLPDPEHIIVCYVSLHFNTHECELGTALECNFGLILAMFNVLSCHENTFLCSDKAKRMEQE